MHGMAWACGCGARWRPAQRPWPEAAVTADHKACADGCRAQCPGLGRATLATSRTEAGEELSNGAFKVERNGKKHIKD